MVFVLTMGCAWAENGACCSQGAESHLHRLFDGLQQLAGREIRVLHQPRVGVHFLALAVLGALGDAHVLLVLLHDGLQPCGQLARQPGLQDSQRPAQLSALKAKLLSAVV